jgi:hypothetical protein
MAVAIGRKMEEKRVQSATEKIIHNTVKEN